MEKTTADDLHEALKRIEERLKTIESKEEPGAEHRAQLAQNLNERFADLSQAVAQYIRAHPVRSATIAFLLGLIVASRRGGR